MSDRRSSSLYTGIDGSTLLLASSLSHSRNLLPNVVEKHDTFSAILSQGSTVSISARGGKRAFPARWRQAVTLSNRELPRLDQPRGRDTAPPPSRRLKAVTRAGAADHPESATWKWSRPPCRRSQTRRSMSLIIAGPDSSPLISSNLSEKQCSKLISSSTKLIIPITVLLEPISHQ